MASETVYTIGYGNRQLVDFLELLQRYQIHAVCDVRSQPYSSRYPDYARVPLREALRAREIRYVFLGKELGARPSDPDLYENGRASYQAMATSAAFRQGIERVKKGVVEYSIALLCAETDPLDCHRAILIAPSLVAAGIAVSHIDRRGTLESQADLERRLLRKEGLDQSVLFAGPTDLNPIEEAYKRRARELAYDIDAAYQARQPQ
jgi:uncharacterized protein (DUF488 family)